MSSFVKMCDNISFGDNGSAEHLTTKNNCLDLFFQAVRGLSYESIDKYINTIVSNNNKNEIIDLFVLAFQTRDCRGGKGEKLIFYYMILSLYKKFPKIVLELVKLIAEFGYYKDLWLIVSLTKNELDINDPLINEIFDVYANQLFEDHTSSLYNQTISLAAKFAPREGHHFAVECKPYFKKFVNEYVFPNSKTSLKEYRLLISKLNKYINTTEINMCNKSYSLIDFKKVPSICLNKFRKAFLNELVKKAPEKKDELTGNRFPDDIDRVTARIHLNETIEQKKIKGKQLMPHEITNKLLEENSVNEIKLLQTQWDLIKESIIENSKNKPINLGNFVPLVDVSGSMEGEPMEVAIALGILISEITHDDFKNRIITFSEKPTWVKLNDNESIKEKCLKVKKANWGTSTNFESAIKMILDVVLMNKLKENEIPNLIVLSDMQFDCANGRNKYETHYKNLQNLFRDAGIAISGTPYKVPKIIFWNLRETKGFPVENNETNTLLLSGFSPSFLKTIMEGEIETPEKLLRKTLDNTKYDIVRDICKNLLF